MEEQMELGMESNEHREEKDTESTDMNNNNVSRWLDNHFEGRDSYSNKDDKGETLCRVCGDISSGRHYGQYTCDGCSGFFMRSVRKNMIYRCKGHKKCIVDKKRRNQCQACRFEKCLQVNMNRYAVQQERQPNSHHFPFQHGRFFGFYHPFYNKEYMLHPQYQMHHGIAYHHAPPTSPKRLTSTLQKKSLNRVPSPQKSILHGETSGAPLPCGEHRSSPPALEMNTVKSYLKEEPKEILDDLLDLAPRLLYHTVKWARSVPAFVEIPIADQVKLLEDSWTEIFVLFIFQWKLMIDSKRILNQTNLKLTDGEFIRISKFYKKIEEYSERFHTLKVSEEEFIYLKSIVLFKPEVIGLYDPRYIERCQDRAQLMLRDYITSTSTDQPARFGKLLLLLPEIKQIQGHIFEETLFKPSNRNFAFEALLADLFKVSR